MERARDDRDGAHAEIGRQTRSERVAQHRRVDGRAETERQDVGARVHSGVGARGPGERDGRLRERVDDGGGDLGGDGGDEAGPGFNEAGKGEIRGAEDGFGRDGRGEGRAQGDSGEAAQLPGTIDLDEGLESSSENYKVFPRRALQAAMKWFEAADDAER